MKKHPLLRGISKCDVRRTWACDVVLSSGMPTVLCDIDGVFLDGPSHTKWGDLLSLVSTGVHVHLLRQTSLLKTFRCPAG